MGGIDNNRPGRPNVAVRWFLGWVALVLSPGCGPPEAHVSGKVTMDGKPIPGAQVIFHPEDEKNTTPIGARAEDDGSYRLTGLKGGGIPVGKYKVTVTREGMKEGPIPQGEKALEARANGLIQNRLPKLYEDRATTPFEADVHAGPNTVDLDLKKKP